MQAVKHPSLAVWQTCLNCRILSCTVYVSINLEEDHLLQPPVTRTRHRPPANQNRVLGTRRVCWTVDGLHCNHNLNRVEAVIPALRRRRRWHRPIGCFARSRPAPFGRLGLRRYDVKRIATELRPPAGDFDHRPGRWQQRLGPCATSESLSWHPRFLAHAWFPKIARTGMLPYISGNKRGSCVGWWCGALSWLITPILFHSSFLAKEMDPNSVFVHLDDSMATPLDRGLGHQLWLLIRDLASWLRCS